MRIAGIDYSKNCPAVVKFELDDNLDIVEKDYISFTTVKKTAALDSKLIFHHKKEFKDDFIKAETHRDDIRNFLGVTHTYDYIAFEHYALNAKGKVFDIAESTACIKFYLYDRGIKLRFYDPLSIKMFWAEKGNVDKKKMQDIHDEHVDGFDLAHLPQYNNPREDICDAFWVAKMLQMELKVRQGILHTRTFPEHQVKVFNRCTKAYPENILVREFTQK